MTMFSICREVVQDGRLEQDLAAMAKAEAKFTREIGVLDRHYYQCVQQPHLIWACTEWTTEKAHNDAAAGIMKVRKDDRVASACFRPGLYFEIFGRPVPGLCRRFAPAGEEAGLIVVCHGLVADKRLAGWRARVAERLAALDAPAGLLEVTVHENVYAHAEFVAWVHWRDDEAYAAARAAAQPDDEARAVSPSGEVEARTLEEHLFIAAPRSDLAAYDQTECRWLSMVPPGAN
jgi:heme-degrading monooxygenase HmoA